MSRLAEAALEAFFDEAAEEHIEAERLAGAVEHELRFADRRLRLRFAGPALADCLLPAVASRQVAIRDRPDVTIGLWEERTSDGCALSVPWRDVDLGARGLVRTGTDDRVLAVHEGGSGAVTLVDREARRILYRVPDASLLPWWERAAPLRPALFWALAGPDRCLVHAGSAGDADRGGVLIAGASGSGKTTVALAALAAGMRYVSDDYVLLHGGPEPVAWNLYGTAKLDAGHLLRFPQFASAGVPNDPDEKAVLSVLEEAPGALVEQLPIRAIVVPRVRGGRAAVRASSAADALLALAPSTALQMPFDNGRALAVLADVARAVPCFALDVGDDPGDLAVALNRVLDGDVVGPTGRSAAH